MFIIIGVLADWDTPSAFSIIQASAFSLFALVVQMVFPARVFPMTITVPPSPLSRHTRYKVQGMRYARSTLRRLNNASSPTVLRWIMEHGRLVHKTFPQRLLIGTMLLGCSLFFWSLP